MFVKVSCCSVRFYAFIPSDHTVALGSTQPLMKMSEKGKGLPQQAKVAQGILGRLKAPDFLDVRHYKGGRLSALRTGLLYPRRNPWYSFLEAESTPGHMVLSVAMEKIPSDTTGNQSRDCPTSSAVP